jgi:hypothetical protein
MKPSAVNIQKVLFNLLCKYQSKQNMNGGYIIVVVMGLIIAMSGMLLTAALTSKVDSNSTKASGNSAGGFYAAEAGLNIRAKDIRSKFVGYNVPLGTSPSAVTSCNMGASGTGDFALNTSLSLQDPLNPNDSTKRIPVATYVVNANKTDTSGNAIPTPVTINPGEPFAGLNAQEYRYDVISTACDRTNQPTASLAMRFKSRLVPMFQFAVFYNQDLDFQIPPTMTMNGPLHTNGSMYLNSANSNTLAINSQLSMGGRFYRGARLDTGCSGTVNVYSAISSSLQALSCGSGRKEYFQADVNPTWGANQIKIGIPVLTLPPISSFDPNSTGEYWSKADLRIVLKLKSDKTFDSYEVQNVDGSVNSTATSALLGSTCASNTVSNSNGFENYREKVNPDPTTAVRNDSKKIQLLHVDIQKLMTCANTLMGKTLNDSTDGGLVWFFSVKGGPDSSTDVTATPPGPPNTYGIRLDNGNILASNNSTDPQIRGLTVVSDQAVYIRGDYNCGTLNTSPEPSNPYTCSNKKPASIMADTINVLSNNWPNNNYPGYTTAESRNASDTVINAAFLSGIDLTGGGVNNYPRFHENWSGDTLRYSGSMVSLGLPRRVNGHFCGSQSTNSNCNIYSPPTRRWRYDTDFNNAANLPPLSPRFVYLRQERFSRNYDRVSFAPISPSFASISSGIASGFLTSQRFFF